MMGISPMNYILAAVCATAPLLVLKLCKSSKLDHIPSVGYSSWLGSYISAFKFVRNAAQILQEGYAKHKGKPFKVPTLNRWIVVIGRHHLEDIKKFTDDELSSLEASNNSFKADYLFGTEINSLPPHISVVRIYLTRNLGLCYPDMTDEVHTAFEELLDLKDNGWKSVPAVETMREIICRASNRVIVGLPLCRDPDWIDLNSRYAVDVATDASILNMFPEFLVPLVSKVLPNTGAGIKRAMKHLDPIVQERLRCMREHGDEWCDKPNDLLQWFIEAKQECTARQLTVPTAVTNFASIFILTQALYNLAAYPQYVGPLREEVDPVIRQHGWTKEAMALMPKVDSFLAETLRLDGITSSVQRKAMKDLTLSDGTFIPKGTHLSILTSVIHHDSAVYEDPCVFDPFRFSRRRDDGIDNARYQMVGVTQDYLPFGYGKHACPGRFLVANELKTTLAHILTSYDVKLEDRVSRPPSIHWDENVMADPTVRVMFRKRANN